MKQETFKKAVKVINRNLRSYQRKLTYQLELMNEALLKNGNLKHDSFDADKNLIEKYEIILADLATIKRAIINNKTEVKLYGTLDNGNMIYSETSKVLGEAGFIFEGDGFGTEITLTSIDELEEEWKEEERMAMQLNGLMAEFED